MRRLNLDGAVAWIALEWAYKLLTALVVALFLAAAIFFVSGCASTWAAVKSAAAPAGGAAGGALVGSTLGPGGMVGGAALGAVVGDSIEENASLRSGETIGEGALKKEQARWNGRTAEEWAGLASTASGSYDYLTWLLKWAAVGAVAWVAVRNRHNFQDLGFKRGLMHALFGGTVGKAKA